jgi:Protein tyrosine and serine/threonine kinase/SH2 domain
LRGYVRDKKSELSVFDRLDVAMQIARGLSWLHQCEPPILHLDIKFDNVLYDDRGVMKVTDFGLSAFLPDDYVVSELRLPGNLGHMPPEVIRRHMFNDRADVFSFGILLWELMRGLEWEEEIFEHLADANISANGDVRQIVKAAIVFRNFRPKLHEHWPLQFRELLERLWHADMEQRPSMQQVVAQHLPALDRVFRVDIVDRHLGFDDVARAFYLLPEMFESLPAPVPAASFLARFYDFMHWPWPAQPDEDIRLLFLQLALGVLDESASSAPTAASSSASSSSSSSVVAGDAAAAKVQQSGPCVDIERLAKLVGAFGPLRIGDTRFLSNIEHCLDNLWFHPDLESGTSKLLQGQAPGTFVVRFSRQHDVPFSVTRVAEIDGVSHLLHSRIRRVGDDNAKFQLAGTKHAALADLQFDTLKDLVENKLVREKLGLTRAKLATLTAAQKLRRRRFDTSLYDDADIDQADSFALLQVLTECTDSN